MLEDGIGAPPYPFPGDSFGKSQFLEVLFPDIVGTECTSINNPPGCAFPNEILQAHGDILAPPLITISFPAPSSTTHWYTALPLGGSVAAAAQSGQTIQQLQCTGAASGSGVSGFALDITSQGAPALVKCTAADSAGVTGESVHALWIDTAPPVTTSTTRVSPSGATTATFTATDNLSGVAETEFSLDGGLNWTVANSVFIVHSGTYTFLYRSRDVAGNLEKAKSVTVSVVISGTPGPCSGTCI
jgi:hypothetical protein